MLDTETRIVIFFYFILPTIILEVIFRVIESWFYQPPLWASIPIVTLIPFVGFPLAWGVLYAMNMIVMFISDISGYARQLRSRLSSKTQEA